MSVVYYSAVDNERTVPIFSITVIIMNVMSCGDIYVERSVYKVTARTIRLSMTTCKQI